MDSSVDGSAMAGDETPVEQAEDAVRSPRRIALVKRGTSAQVRRGGDDEEHVMAFPHLIAREIVAFQVIVVVLAVLSLAFDAPLEGIANPEHTPNPAKAPWYFLGLQELLHYFPPVVAGVLIPALVLLHLVVIPYVEVNVLREPLWKGRPQRNLRRATILFVIALALTLPFHAYPIAVPSLMIYGLLLLSYVSQGADGWRGWLHRRSVSDWIMTWFVVVAVILTAIGVLFRGPGWRWTWPWIDGIY